MVGVSARAIRIGVLDNDPFALDAMCAMISAVSKDFRVMWSTGSPAVAIEHCHNPHTRPEVLVLDMALGGITGADVCRRIRRRTGGTGIVCVTSYSVDVYQREAIASGAQGSNILYLVVHCKKTDTLGGSRPSRRRTGRCGFS